MVIAYGPKWPAKAALVITHNSICYIGSRIGWVVVVSHSRYFQHAHFIPIVGVGKRGEY